MADMEEEIRENAGDEMQDNISNLEGTKKWGNLETNASGSSGESGESGESGGSQQEFPRASEEEVFEAAERAKAEFGGTAGGGGGVESDADQSIAQGAPPSSDPGDYQAAQEGSAASGATPASREENPSAEDVADEAEAGDEMTTGQKFASIMSSDPNMKWESKIAEKMSGGDDENTAGV